MSAFPKGAPHGLRKSWMTLQVGRAIPQPVQKETQHIPQLRLSRTESPPSDDTLGPCSLQLSGDVMTLDASTPHICSKETGAPSSNLPITRDPNSDKMHLLQTSINEIGCSWRPVANYSTSWKRMKKGSEESGHSLEASATRAKNTDTHTTTKSLSIFTPVASGAIQFRKSGDETLGKSEDEPDNLAAPVFHCPSAPWCFLTEHTCVSCKLQLRLTTQ